MVQGKLGKFTRGVRGSSCWLTTTSRVTSVPADSYLCCHETHTQHCIQFIIKSAIQDREGNKWLNSWGSSLSGNGVFHSGDLCLFIAVFCLYRDESWPYLGVGLLERPETCSRLDTILQDYIAMPFSIACFLEYCSCFTKSKIKQICTCYTEPCHCVVSDLHWTARAVPQFCRSTPPPNQGMFSFSPTYSESPVSQASVASIP